MSDDNYLIDKKISKNEFDYILAEVRAEIKKDYDAGKGSKVQRSRYKTTIKHIDDLLLEKKLHVFKYGSEGKNGGRI